jgi:ethanolamine ammonia-lyase large subunit
VTVRRGTLAGSTYEFASPSDLLAKATPARSGDVLAGCAAESQAQRVAAQTVLADVPLQDDDVSRLILDTHDPAAFAPVASQTVGEFREWLLARAAVGTRPPSAGWRRA